MPKARVIYQVQSIETEPRAGGKAEREIGRRLVAPFLVARARADVVAMIDGLRTRLASRELLPVDAPDAGEVADAFDRVYARRPLRDNAGGTMRNSSTWVFVVARLLQPSLIVESGTFMGHSS